MPKLQCDLPGRSLIPTVLVHWNMTTATATSSDPDTQLALSNTFVIVNFHEQLLALFSILNIIPSSPFTITLNPPPCVGESFLPRVLYPSTCSHPLSSHPMTSTGDRIQPLGIRRMET